MVIQEVVVVGLCCCCCCCCCFSSGVRPGLRFAVVVVVVVFLYLRKVCYCCWFPVCALIIISCPRKKKAIFKGPGIR